MSARRTLYTTADEERELRALSASRDTTINTIIRIALRKLLGLPVPSWADDLTSTPKEPLK